MPEFHFVEIKDILQKAVKLDFFGLVLLFLEPARLLKVFYQSNGFIDLFFFGFFGIFQVLKFGRKWTILPFLSRYIWEPKTPVWIQNLIIDLLDKVLPSIYFVE